MVKEKIAFKIPMKNKHLIEEHAPQVLHVTKIQMYFHKLSLIFSKAMNAFAYGKVDLVLWTFITK